MLAKLSPIEHSAPTGVAQRTEPRAPTSLVATLRAGDGPEFPVVVRDVSTRGALIETDETPQPDARYTLTFSAFSDTYSADLEVVRCETERDGYLWGCRMDLRGADPERLRSAVRAALGHSATQVRAWQDIRDEAQLRPGEKVIAGYMPSGKAIELTAEDALAIGANGVELFVQVVASIETM